MNKLRGVRQILLLGLLTCTTEMAAAAVPTAPMARVQGLHAAPISAHQWCVLDLARDRAVRTDLAQTFQAIVLQESSAGIQLVNKKDPSYGAAGVKLDTASAWLDRDVTAGELVSDTAMNLDVGFGHLVECAAAFASWRRAVVCYNRGVDGTRGRTDAQISADAYLAAITGRLTELKAIRRHTDTCPRD